MSHTPHTPIQQHDSFAPSHHMGHAARLSLTRQPMIEFGHGTHVGLRRTRNEDTYYADASLGLFLVADGMGGHQHGEVASARVRDRVTDLILQKQGLADAIRDAGKDLYEHARSANDPLPMGTTIASLQLGADGYEVAWVGDSRIYLWHGGRLKQVSHDHSLVQELVAAGRLAPRRLVVPVREPSPSARELEAAGRS